MPDKKRGCRHWGQGQEKIRAPWASCGPLGHIPGGDLEQGTDFLEPQLPQLPKKGAGTSFEN